MNELFTQLSAATIVLSLFLLENGKWVNTVRYGDEFIITNSFFFPIAEKDAEIEELHAKLDTILQTGEKSKKYFESAKHDRDIIERKFEKLQEKYQELEKNFQEALTGEDRLQEKMKKVCQQMRSEINSNTEVLSMYKDANDKISNLERRLQGLNDELNQVTRDLVKKDEENTLLRQVWDFVDDSAIKWASEKRKWNEDDNSTSVVDCSLASEFSKEGCPKVYVTLPPLQLQN